MLIPSNSGRAIPFGRTTIRAAVWIGVMACAARGFAQPTQFTYQGQLKDGGAAVNGPYDFTFRLFDADVAGTQIGIDFPLPAIDVTNGLFTVALDFGAGVFDGSPRWLEIEINGAVLAPRQALTATPYAQTCTTAYSSTYAAYANGAGYAFAPWVPSGTDLYYLDGNVGIGTDVPTARLEIGGTPGVDGIKFPDGSIQTSAAGLGGGGFWTDNGADIFNNNGGNVGIGLTTPLAKLHVGGTAGVDGIMFPDGSLQTTAAIGGAGSSVWSLNGINTYYNAGRVGIGTSSPLSKLDIVATGNGAEVLRLSTERPWVFRQDGTGSGSYLQLYSTTGLKQFEVTSQGGQNVATFQANDADPRVGIGTRQPLAKLDITQNIIGQDLLRLSTERPWIFRQKYSGPSAGLQLISTSGQKPFEISCVDGTNCATFMADQTNPRVGIGTTAPVSKLDIVGQDGLGITGFQPFITLRDSNSGNVRARIQNTFADIHFYTEASFINGVPMMSIRNNGTTSVKVLEIRGGADVSEQFEISDPSGGEMLIGSSRSEIAPGTVVSIDEAHPGKLMVTGQAYDRKVAGIISGAGGVNTGMLMGQQGSIADGHYPVALTGRVWVRCDAGAAPVAPGDMLTSSHTPGHAMKATDRDKAFGAVIGKAMTGLKEGKGLVLVLVTLQ